MACRGATIFRLEESDLVALAHQGNLPDAEACRLSFPLADLGDNALLIQNGLHVVIEDALDGSGESQAFRHAMGWQSGSVCKKLRSWLGIPVYADGRLTGLLALDHDQPGAFGPAQVDAGTAFVRDMAPRIENSMLYAQSDRRADELASLIAVQTAISKNLELEIVLQLITDEAQRLTHARRAMVFFLDGENLILKTFSGEPDPNSSIKPGYAMPVQASLTGLAVLSRRSIRGTDPIEQMGVDEHITKSLRTTSFIICPLIIKDQALGAIVVTDKILGKFGARDEQILFMLAPAAAIGIENARLHQKTKQQAIIEERGRLSREMHDSLSQSLGILKLKSAMAVEFLAGHHIERLEQVLNEMHDISAEAYTHARETIFNLRSIGPDDIEFVTIVQRYLNHYRAGFGVDVRLDLEEKSAIALVPQASVQVLRIIQEALSNVRKHANTSTAIVTIESTDGLLRVQIEDEGQGFAPTAVKSQGVGLSVMHERAQSIGGRLEIDGKPGRGTRITLWVPQETQ